VREFRFVLSKQALIVFLVVFLTAGAFLGTPVRAQTIAGGPQPLLQARSSTDTWSQVSTSPTPTARWGHAMATTPEGVLLFGGSDGTSQLNDTWRFNTATNSWGLLTGSPSTPPARVIHAIAATPLGVLLFGGWNSSSNSLNDTWRFNTATNSWGLLTGSPSTPTARYGHAMAATPSGNVLLFGGEDSSGTLLDDTWLFNTATNTWGQITGSPSTPPARCAHAMAATTSGDVLLFGGWDGSGNSLNDTWRYGPAALTITTTSLPNGAVGVPYNQTLTATGGSGPYNWSLASGSLPGGLTLTATSGGITGTPLAAGLFSFIAHATDGTTTATQSLSITINAPPTVTLHLQPGWNLVSIPAITDSAPNTVFAGLPLGWVLYSWDGVNSRYTSKVDTVLQIGAGFWLRVTQAVDYEVAGTPYAPNSLPIPLANGWNIVGIPYPVNINWTAVQFLYNGSTYSLDQAITNGWIGAGVFNWTGTGYGNAKFAGYFAPTSGYWVRSLVSGASLIFIRP
jgi:hypothetical protein